VYYIINGVHRYAFFVQANVVKTWLKISHSKLVFEYASSNTKMYTTEILKLKNKGNALAKFYFKLYTENSFFSIKPMEGEIKKQE